MNDLQKVIYEYNEIKVRVLELENRLSELNVPTEQVKWQPKGGEWLIDAEGLVVKARVSWLSKEFGTVRQTKEQAERASVEMRRFNRLLALRDELCGNEVVNWENEKDKHYLYYWNGNEPKWRIATDTYCRVETPYFTNYDLAQKACEMLNDGEVEL